MIITDLHFFKNKNILFLQGPVGPFFNRIGAQLRKVGARVFKINFNGGDWLFGGRDAINFRQHPRQWATFFEQQLLQHQIEAVILFGDCRPIHATARRIALKHNIAVFVFEEGYVRPNFVTLERFGVNNHSLLPRDPDFYLQNVPVPQQHEQELGYSFHMVLLWGFLYYTTAITLQPFFRQYRHHRPLQLSEGKVWLRSFGRKLYYRHKEKGVLAHLTGPLSKSFYLVPLQVYNDSQILTHSNFKTVKAFIKYVAQSFAAHAPSHTHLVFKHHPMDRGYHDYHQLISKLGKQLGIAGRLHYIHDQHLPSLLTHAIGTIVVNSTVGFSSLYHNTPVKTCGMAVYDIKGLTYQGSLHTFWHEAPGFQINRRLFTRFRNYMILTTQLNGSFYKRFKTPHGRYHISYNKNLPEGLKVHPSAIIEQPCMLPPANTDP